NGLAKSVGQDLRLPACCGYQRTPWPAAFRRNCLLRDQELDHWTSAGIATFLRPFSAAIKREVRFAGFVELAADGALQVPVEVCRATASFCAARVGSCS